MNGDFEGDTMRTHLIVYFGTNGVGPSEIAKRVEEVGFTTTFGPYDFVYDWDHAPKKEEILALGDKVCKALEGTGTVFNLDTHD